MYWNWKKQTDIQRMKIKGANNLNDKRRCDTCEFYDNGKCIMLVSPVEKDYKCAAWHLNYRLKSNINNDTMDK